MKNEPGLRRWWSAITAILVTAAFAQAVFAGAMLSGVDWARDAHWANAILLIVSTLAAGLVSVITLRRVPRGLQLGLSLLSLAAVIVLQAASGKMATNGVNLMWVHVPLGVALVGFAAYTLTAARRLGAG